MSGLPEDFVRRAIEQAQLERFGIPVVNDITKGDPRLRKIVDIFKSATRADRLRARNPARGTWEERSKIDLGEKDAADKLDNLLQQFFERLSDIYDLSRIMESALSQIGFGPSPKDNAALRNQASSTNYAMQVKLSELRDWMNVDVED
jgi:hypothetical protein